MEAEERIAMLDRAMAKVRQLSPHYDEVLRDVSARINASASVGKGDIATLAFWKRIRTESWAEDFLCLSEVEVRNVTAPVVAAAWQGEPIVSASRARELLRKASRFCEGFSDVLSSANRRQAR